MHKAQAMLGHPTNRKFIGMVHLNMIANCDVTESADKNAHTIFGLNLAGVQGRIARVAMESVCVQHVQILRAILDKHRIVTLTEITCLSTEYHF